MRAMKKVNFWKIPTHRDARGGLSSIEWRDIPFKPQRVYFIFDVKGKRGGHAHKKEKEVFVCIKGKFRASVHDGKRWKRFKMAKPGDALFNENMVWHEFDNFSTGAIMLAISSIPYDGKKGYIMSFDEFLSLCKPRRKKS